MIPLLEHRKAALEDLCRRHGVLRLDVFGSGATGEFHDATSDLEFIAEFADRSAGYADRYLDFAEALEALLGRRVDLLTERSIRDPSFRRSVEAQRQTVYDGRSGEAAA